MTDWKKHFTDLSVDAIFREEEPSIWETTYNKLTFRPVVYLSWFMDYQRAYHAPQTAAWDEASCVLRSDGKPIGLWSISLCKGSSGHTLTSQGQPLKTPCFVRDCPESTKKKLTATCLEIAERIAAECEIPQWTSEVQNIDDASIGYWQLEAMTQGSSCKVKHELYVNLQLSLEEIKSKFRRRFRSFVNSAGKTWTAGILKNPGNESLWAEFRELHYRVAGRSTRSLESWQIQHSTIAAGMAFLAYLRDSDGLLIGGGYFTFSPDEGLYCVGAYDRSLYDKPVSHLVQYNAIKELKGLGCSWYRIGTRSFHADTPTPTEKELSISHFKEGFASHVFPTYQLTHSTGSKLTKSTD